MSYRKETICSRCEELKGEVASLQLRIRAMQAQLIIIGSMLLAAMNAGLL